MSAKHGSLSINSENIFPIIKKWLYSDHDIFIRELVSNGCDAVTKLKKLSVMGEFEEADDEKYKVEVRINPTDKTLTFIDNGIGMTESELSENLGTIAKSGSLAFKEGLTKEDKINIIGQFGVGFYSSFMVADKVCVESKKTGCDAYKWVSKGASGYEIEKIDKIFSVRTSAWRSVRKQKRKRAEVTVLYGIVEKYVKNICIRRMWVTREYERRKMRALFFTA